MKKKDVNTTRAKKDVEVKGKEQINPSVSAGAVDKVIDLAFNPTRDKIREVTVIDRMQGRLFPQLDMVCMMRDFCLEIAQYRENQDIYKDIYKQEKPIPPKPLEELIFRSAQWQKSVAGKNLERAIDIALAETEAKAGDDDFTKPDEYYKD